jgi:hypothetical protein
MNVIKIIKYCMKYEESLPLNSSYCQNNEAMLVFPYVDIFHEVETYFKILWLGFEEASPDSPSTTPTAW